MAVMVRIYDKNPNQREVRRVVDALERGGVIIYPTDSVYAFGCSINCPKAVEKLKQICGKDVSRLSVVFASIAQMSEFVRIDNEEFKVLKRNLPGPFTFILRAGSRTPDKVIGKRKTLGVRIPDNTIAAAIVETLGCPMLTASVKDDDRLIEYTTDPGLMLERYGSVLEAVVDGGIGDNIPTTTVDLSEGEPVVVRQGKGELK